MGNQRCKTIARMVALLFVGACSATSASPESCTSISNSSERLACYDAYFMSAIIENAETNETPVADETQSPSVVTLEDTIESSDTARTNTSSAVVASVPAAASVEEATPVSPDVVAEAESRAREAYDQVITDAQAMTISDVQRTRRGSVFFQTEQGRTFKKETSRNVYFSKGDSVVIERGIFSSMFLENQDGLRIKVSEVE